MVFNKPDNFDGIIFLSELAKIDLILDEVVDNGVDQLLVDLDENHRDKIQIVLDTVFNI
jgi:hypothetical protein